MPVPRFLLILFSVLLSVVARSQTEASIEVSVVDTKQEPRRGIEVVFREAATGERVQALTNRAGVAVFTISRAGTWQLYVQGYLYKSRQVSVEENEVSKTTLFLTHDAVLEARIERQSFARDSLVDVSAPAPSIAAPGSALVRVSVTNSAGVRLSGKQVSAVDLAGHQVRTAMTDGAGLATFHLPLRTRYDFDVSEHLNAGFLDLDAKEGYTYSKPLVFDEYNMVETRRNDTVSQMLKEPGVRKNSRAYYSVIVARDGQPAAGEVVFLNDVHGPTVYRAKTTADGEAVFILPFGKSYLIHLPFQRDVDVVDLTTARGRASGSRTVDYQPNPALEHPETFLPSPGQLFLTDFQTYHRTAYPRPGNVLKPGLFLQSQPTGDSRNEAVLEVGLTARFLQAGSRKPLNISFVLDISGSMAGYERIESLKKGLSNLVARLTPTDRISIVLFNDGSELLVPSQLVGGDAKALTELINRITPSGGTDMLQAMQTGYGEVMKGFNARAANAVVLLTDGYDGNPVDVLVAAQKPFLGKVTCMAVGVGSDYNYDLLKKLVTRSDGVFENASEGPALVNLFTERLITLGMPLARNIQIEISYDQRLRCTGSYGLSTAAGHPGGLTATLPDLYTSTEIPGLVTFNAPPGDGSTYPVKVNISYTDAGTGRREQIREEHTLSFAGGDAPRSPAELKKMYAVAFVNESLRQMSDLVGQNKMPEAEAALQRGMRFLSALYPSGNDPDVLALRQKMSGYATAFQNLKAKRKIQRS
jgi:uncharacterized protein YegL